MSCMEHPHCPLQGAQDTELTPHWPERSHMATQLQGRLGNVVLILGSHALLCKSLGQVGWRKPGSTSLMWATQCPNPGAQGRLHRRVEARSSRMTAL